MPLSNDKTPPRPPSDRGQGRKKDPNTIRKDVRSVRLSDQHWQEFRELGGGHWLEPLIDDAIKAKREKENPPS